MYDFSGGKYGKQTGYGYGNAEHKGALGLAGVALSKDGKGYMTAGKWQNGDQITQLKQDDEGVVMRRRTVTKGGSLSGAAHPDVKPET